MIFNQIIYWFPILLCHKYRLNSVYYIFQTWGEINHKIIENVKYNIKKSLNCMVRQCCSEKIWLLNETHRTIMEYLHMSYWLERPQMSLKQYKIFLLTFVTHLNYMIKPYWWRHHTFLLQDMVNLILYWLGNFFYDG